MSSRKIKYVQKNPKQRDSKSYKKYQKYKKAKTVAEFLKLGGTERELTWDLDRGFVEYLTNADDVATGAETHDGVQEDAARGAMSIDEERGEELAAPVAQDDDDSDDDSEDPRDRKDVEQPVELSVLRPNILLLGDTHAGSDGAHVASHVVMTHKVDGEWASTPLFVGGGVYAGQEPAQLYAVAYGLLSSTFVQGVPSSRAFVVCYKVKTTHSRHKLQDDAIYRIGAEQIVGYCSLENSVHVQLKTAMELDKYKFPHFAGMNGVADGIDSFNSMGNLGGTSMAKFAARVLADSMDYALRGRFPDPRSWAKSQRIEASALDGEIVQLFTEFSAGAPTPSFVPSEALESAILERFPADFATFALKLDPTRPFLPLPKTARVRRRQGLSERDVNGAPTAGSGGDAPAKRKRSTSSSASSASSASSPPRWRERHFEKTGNLVPPEAKHWHGAEEGKKKRGRPSGTKAGKDFAAWGAASTKEATTKTKIYDESAPVSLPDTRGAEKLREQNAELKVQVDDLAAENAQLKTAVADLTLKLMTRED
jgi:hypothetical protein